MLTGMGRVLVVDDDEVMRDVLSLVLESETYDVVTAASGEEALALLAGAAAGQRLLCVLTDLQMPGLSGKALADALRKTCAAETRLIAMSGSEPEAGERAAYDGFLLKPFSVEDFTATLDELQLPVTTADKRDEGPSSHGKPAEEALDPEVYRKLRASMPAAQLAALYTLCLDDAAMRAERMRAAAQSGDSAAFVREAHAVKGGCGMVGAREMGALAARMEAGALACTSLLTEFTVAVARLRRMLEAHR